GSRLFGSGWSLPVGFCPGGRGIVCITARGQQQQQGGEPDRGFVHEGNLSMAQSRQAIQRRATCVAAHTASFSRNILALWRVSTGRPGCSKKSSIWTVCACDLPSSRNSLSNFLRAV